MDDGEMTVRTWAIIRNIQSQGKDIIWISAFFFPFFFHVWKLPPQGMLLKHILATFVV